ncbi:hypothetical protein CSUI_006294, partial [Cystoisospora suis]
MRTRIACTGKDPLIFQEPPQQGSTTSIGVHFGAHTVGQATGDLGFLPDVRCLPRRVGLHELADGIVWGGKSQNHVLVHSRRSKTPDSQGDPSCGSTGGAPPFLCSVDGLDDKGGCQATHSSPESCDFRGGVQLSPSCQDDVCRSP